MRLRRVTWPPDGQSRVFRLQRGIDSHGGLRFRAGWRENRQRLQDGIRSLDTALGVLPTLNQLMRGGMNPPFNSSFGNLWMV